MRIHSLFYHYLKSSTLLLLLTVLASSGASYLFAEHILVSTVKEDLQYHADFRKERILTQFNEQKLWMETVSEDSRFLEFTENLIMSYQGRGKESASYQLLQKRFRKEYQGVLHSQSVEELFLLTTEGELIFSLRPMDEEIGEVMNSDGFYGETILSELLEEIAAARRFSISRYGKIELLESSTVLMGIPIFSSSIGEEDEVVGILVRTFPLDRVRQLLSSYSGLGQTGEVVIAQRRGDGEGEGVYFLNYFRNDNEVDEKCIELRLESFHLFGMSKAVSGENGSGWQLDYRCQQSYSAWSWIPELKWGMLVKQGRDEIMAPIKSLQERLFMGTLALVLLLIWVARRQSRILSSPLGQLIHSIEQCNLHNHPLSEVKEVNTLSRTLQGAISGLEQALNSADKANQSKDEFLASMSHELRTPLTSIIGNAEYLLDRSGDPESQEVLQTIEASGKAQLALVNDILDMSKIQSGKFSIDLFPFDLAELLQGVESMVSVRAHEAGLRLKVRREGNEKFKLLGDANRISQILINLLSNAIKFSKDGEVHLYCWNDGKKLHFKVEDSGIGMSPETLERLFKRFEQADGSISRRFGGSGLGLFISLNLAEMMGGTIEVSSTEGIGSIFQLIIPYEISNVPVSEYEEDKSKQLAGSEKFRGNVLIAEDTPELQLLEKRILVGSGLTVEVANDGVEAVMLAEQHHFDLILMDMQMPHMDGIQATKVLRERNIKTPVVALTANVMQKHRDAFQQAGCDGFLTKPIDRPKLRKILKQFLVAGVDAEVLEPVGRRDNRIQERREADTSVETSERRTAHRRIRDQVEEAANRQHSDVNEFVDEEMMEIFRESAVKYRASLSDALSVRDWDRIKEVAHPIKGSGTSFGFPQLTERAKAVCDAYDNGETGAISGLVENLIAELDAALS